MPRKEEEESGVAETHVYVCVHIHVHIYIHIRIHVYMDMRVLDIVTVAQSGVAYTRCVVYTNLDVLDTKRGVAARDGPWQKGRDNGSLR